MAVRRQWSETPRFLPRNRPRADRPYFRTASSAASGGHPCGVLSAVAVDEPHEVGSNRREELDDESGQQALDDGDAEIEPDEAGDGDGQVTTRECTSIDSTDDDNRAHDEGPCGESERRGARSGREDVPVHPFQRLERVVGDDSFARVDDRVRTDQADGAVTERRREDVHHQRDERTKQRPGKDTDETGEVHVDTAPDGDVQLEDGKTRRRTDTGERYLMCLDTALPDPVDDCADEPGPQQRPEDQRPHRKRTFSEVDVCHSWLLICVSDIINLPCSISGDNKFGLIVASVLLFGAAIPRERRLH